MVSHGWALESTAVFVASMSDSVENVGLWMQQGYETRCIGMFASPEVAQDFSDFMDAALAATGNANTKLLADLERMRDETQAGDHRPGGHDQPRLSPTGRRSGRAAHPDQG